MFEEFDHFFQEGKRSSYNHRSFVDGVENSTVKKVKYNKDLAIGYIGLSKPLKGKVIDMKKRKYRLYFSPFIGIAGLYGCDAKRYVDNIPMTSVSAIIFEELHSGRYDLSTGCVPNTTVIVVSPSDRKSKKIKSTEYVYKIDMSKYKNNIYTDTQLQSSDIYMLKGIDRVPVMLNPDGSPDVIRHKTERMVLYCTPEEYECKNGTNMSFFNEFTEFINNESIFQESYDNDYTSGTSDFNDISHYEPDDCYCESMIRTNQVYFSGDIKKIEDFKFDRVYFGSPYKHPETMKLNGPLFISPYPGIASIFSVRPQDISKYGVKPGTKVNRGYDEWNSSLINTVLQKPLKELHVRIEGAPDIKETVEDVSGYLYEIDVTPEIRDHIYQSSKMSKVFEFCIDKMDSIKFSNIKKIDVKMIVTGAESRKSRPTQESVLPTKERNKLNDSDFGIPETRSYPLHDKSHVEAAVRMFPNAPLKYRKSLAKRILRKAHEFNMDTSNWKSLNKYMGSD